MNPVVCRAGTLACLALLTLAANVRAGQIAPNPNPAGATIVVANGAVNGVPFTNFGTLDVGPGITFTNETSGSLLTWGGQPSGTAGIANHGSGALAYNFGSITLQYAGASLDNTGGARFQNGADEGVVLATDPGIAIVDGAAFRNAGAGTTFTNQNRAELSVSGAGVVARNEAGALFLNRSLGAGGLRLANGAAFVNTGAGTVLCNLGIVEARDPGTILYTTGGALLQIGDPDTPPANGADHPVLSLGPGAALVNDGPGSMLLNFDEISSSGPGTMLANAGGATLLSGIASDSGTPRVVLKARIANALGATLLNTGAGSVLQSATGILNSDPGSILGNLDGAKLEIGSDLVSNPPPVALQNHYGATLVNAGQGSLLVVHSGADLRNLVTGSTLVNLDGARILADFGSSVVNEGTLFNSGAGSSVVLKGYAINFTGTWLNSAGASMQIGMDDADLGSHSLAGFLFQNETLLVNLGAGTKLSIRHDALLANYHGQLLVLDGAELTNTTGAQIVSGFGSLVGVVGTGSRLLNTSQVSSDGVDTAFMIVNGARVENGTAAESAQFVNSGGALLLNNGGTLVNFGTVKNRDANTLVFNATGSTLRNEAGGSIANQTGAMLRNEGELANLGAIDNSGSLVNAGSFTIGTQAAVGGTGTYRQERGVANLTRVDGVMAQSAIELDGGTLAGLGTLRGMVALDGVTVAPGAFAPLTIEGDLAFTSGVLDIGVLDLAQFDRLVVSGTAALGTLIVRFDFGTGATVYAGERYEFLSAGALALDAAHLSFQSNGLAAGLGIAVDTGAQALVLRIVGSPALAMAPQARLAAAPVPLPPALWLFSCGLAGLLRRRR